MHAYILVPRETETGEITRAGTIFNFIVKSKGHTEVTLNMLRDRGHLAPPSSFCLSYVWSRKHMYIHHTDRQTDRQTRQTRQM